MKHIIVVDTLGWIYRQYFNAPSLMNNKAKEVGLVNRFFKNLQELIYTQEPDFLILAMDNKGTTIRSELDSDYKANHASMPKDLASQLALIEKVLNRNKIKLIRIDNQEADDVIASVCEDYKSKYVITVVGYDKDFNQLISKGSVRIFDPSKKTYKTYNSFIKQFSFEPKLFTHYQSLVGDDSDNVKGVKGIGSVTAQILVGGYGSLNEIYSNLEGETKAIQSKLLAGKESAYKSLELVTLNKELKPIKNLLRHRVKLYQNIEFKILELS